MLKVVFDETAPVADNTALEAAVDADIAAFNEWFLKKQRDDQALEPQGLVRSERAILKTYLFFKTRGERKDDGT